MSLVENYLLNFLTILINYSKSSKLELSWFFVRYALVLIKSCNRSGLPKVNISPYISVLFAILSLSFWLDNLSLFTQNNWRMAAVNCTQPYTEVLITYFFKFKLCHLCHLQCTILLGQQNKTNFRNKQWYIRHMRWNFSHNILGNYFELKTTMNCTKCVVLLIKYIKNINLVTNQLCMLFQKIDVVYHV